MNESPAKRKSAFSEHDPARTSKMARSSSSSTTYNGGGSSATNNGGGTGSNNKKKMSFAERMMAKMGHVQGSGLGKAGEGMTAPIEVNLRPQGVGVGMVREKTQQARENDRRQAKLRGEEHVDEDEDSSEEERKKRKRRQQERRMGQQQQHQYGGAGGGAGSAHKAFARPKVRYETAADIERAAEGLEVPNVLKNIIDATGRETKLLTSGEGIFTTASVGTELVEADKLAKRARKELEAFADTWNELKERAKLIDGEEIQAQKEGDEHARDVSELEELLEAVQTLSKLKVSEPTSDDQTWTQLVQSLEEIQERAAGSSHEVSLEDIAVAAIHLPFKHAMAEWHPLEDPTLLVDHLTRLRPMLMAPELVSETENKHRRRRATTPYESLIYTLWLPKVRSAVTNQWQPFDAASLIIMFEAWKPLLPDFIQDSVINTLVVRKLSDALHSWNPKLAWNRPSKYPSPHIWIFPWLPHLAPSHLDAHVATGLLSDVNRKLRVALDSWDITKGIMPGLKEWVPLLGTTLQNTIIKHILPRLAAHLTTEFEVYPPDQDLTALEQVLVWSELLPSRAMSQLLIAEFFPKWLSTLHQWLISKDVDYDEVMTWYSWWKQQIPASLNESKAITEQFNKGLIMMGEAGDLDDDEKHLLAAPAAGPSRPLVPNVKSDSAAASRTSTKPSRPAAAPRQEQETFKEVLEQWAESEGLMLMPLREAHPTTGLPLFRVTASATGKGGVIVYLKGDVVWAQKRGDRETYLPIELGSALIERAEGR